MENPLQEVKAIKETRDPEEVNQLLQEGWVLDFREHEPSRSRYVLVKFN